MPLMHPTHMVRVVALDGPIYDPKEALVQIVVPSRANITMTVRQAEEMMATMKHATQAALAWKGE